jgi:hypothetical protein
MSVSVHRRPAVALVFAALLTAGLAAPASASSWSDAWARLSGWFARTPLGALWAEQGATIDPSGAPRQVVGNQGGGVDPNGRPIDAQSDAGIGVDPSGEQKP